LLYVMLKCKSDIFIHTEIQSRLVTQNNNANKLYMESI